MSKQVIGSLPEDVIDLTKHTLSRVLHVDDDVCLLCNAKQILELHGQFHVDSASSVKEAGTLGKGAQFTMIIPKNGKVDK